MIRINLLAVERARATKKPRRPHPAGAPRHDRREPDSHRDHPRHRLVVPLAAPAVGAARSGHRQGRSGNGSAALGARAGAEVRGAQGAAHAARHAHRAVAPRPVGAGARARRDQQEPAGPAVADRDQAGRAAISRISGFAASLPSLSDFVANLEATKWFKRPVEILDSQVQTDAEGRRSREVLDQGCAERSRSAAAGASGAGGAWGRTRRASPEQGSALAEGP